MGGVLGLRRRKEQAGRGSPCPAAAPKEAAPGLWGEARGERVAAEEGVLDLWVDAFRLVGVQVIDPSELLPGEVQGVAALVGTPIDVEELRRAPTRRQAVLLIATNASNVECAAMNSLYSTKEF